MSSNIFSIFSLIFFSSSIASLFSLENSALSSSLDALNSSLDAFSCSFDTLSSSFNAARVSTWVLPFFGGQAPGPSPLTYPV